jgi:hypothetical protein
VVWRLWGKVRLEFEGAALGNRFDYLQAKNDETNNFMTKQLWTLATVQQFEIRHRTPIGLSNFGVNKEQPEREWKTCFTR